MKWLHILFAILFTACTIKVESLHPKKRAVKHPRSKVAPHAQRTPSPTPTATAAPKRPLELEHMGEPTPMIKVDQVTRINLSTDPMI